MATNKPRITVTLEEQDYAVLQRLSELQGGSMSRIVSELMSEVTPVLTKVVESLEIAKRAQADVKVNLKKVVDEAEQDLKPLADQVLNQFDMFNAELSRVAASMPANDGAARARRSSGGGEGAGPQPVITGAMKSQRRAKKGEGEVLEAVPVSSKSASKRAK